MQDEDTIYLSTVLMWEDFMDSVLWKDMTNYIINSIESRRSELEQTNVNDLGNIQSEIKVLRKILDLPEDFILVLNNQEELENV